MSRLQALTPLVALIALASCSSSSDATSSFPAAVLVIGQPDFTSAAPDRGGGVSAAGVHFPVGDASYASGSLLLPDTYNHRVLVYDRLPSSSGAPADAVLGQPDATSATPGHGAGRFQYPQSVWSDGSGTLVADAGADRVVLDAGGSPWALGWRDGSIYRWGCGAGKASGPSRAITAAGKLIVADRSNHRVLVWNRVPTGAATPPDLVLGQRDLTHCAANDMLGAGISGGRSARTLRYPTDVWSDGTRLLVVDRETTACCCGTSSPR